MGNKLFWIYNGFLILVTLFVIFGDILAQPYTLEAFVFMGVAELFAIVSYLKDNKRIKFV